MLNRKTTAKLSTALMLGAAMLLHAPAQAQSPAELAPADTPVFIHFNDPADWIGDMTQGPLGEKWRGIVQESEGWGDLLAALDMNVDQFMDAYFGGDLVVLSLGSDADGNELPGVILTKVDQADRNNAIESLGLKRLDDIAGNAVYTGDDGEGFIVMTDEWVAMADLGSYDYLEKILTQADDAPRLAAADHYAKWTQELPADRVMTMLITNNKQDQHALGVVRSGKSLDATYLGVSPDHDQMMAMLGRTNVAEFGPLPADTISAITFNIEPAEEARSGFDKLNILLNGKSFVDNVLPKFDTPTVMFLGSVPGDRVEPAVNVELPVVGMAFKMNDTAVAADMNTMFDSLVMLCNVAVIGFDAGMIPQRVSEYEGATFKVAEVGKPVAQIDSFPQIAPLQIVYGVVGDYYVVCTQEQFFKQCVDANNADKTMRIEVEGKPHRLAVTPVLAMTARPDRFGAMMRPWIQLGESDDLPLLILDAENRPLNTGFAMDVVRMMQQYSSMKLQIWTGEDGLVIGRAQLTAPQ